MTDEGSDRPAIVSEGRYSIVDASAGEPTDFWLVRADTESRDSGGVEVDVAHRVPIDDTEIDDLDSTISRFRNTRSDTTDGTDQVELECHECGKRWTYTGSDDHAACPNCETEVPVKGIGP
ncbi:hypothetical protein EA462_09735 [Natrarchaeobius halalkaliphilus]|uniref:Uncharacterized protein n=1 Tax=Natrarchaeobius halalkaliphilus TaxID=1679091 RepID=A0A3N6M4T4_9EURY|nr:hypothetical protein [Natrarchaeobius halalkaliphilus]RQG90251.1 hypothetical protein EA462_09735 [Natrarchaeobius halalkaliphilus]